MLSQVNYDYVGAIQRAPAYGLGSGDRTGDVLASDAPGPGSYEVTKPELPGFTVRAVWMDLPRASIELLAGSVLTSGFRFGV